MGGGMGWRQGSVLPAVRFESPLVGAVEAGVGDTIGL